MRRYFIFFIPVLVLFFLSSCNNADALLEKGDTLPDYSGITPAGDSLNLSSFLKEDKILLVNFWAGWCSDCLKHNPELVELHEVYKGKKYGGHDFEIVSISLDKDTSLWKRRIIQQNMNWKNHITDLKGWESPQLKDLRVHVIPANYLVDHTGKIIATDISRCNFDKVLKKYYAK